MKRVRSWVSFLLFGTVFAALWVRLTGTTEETAINSVILAIAAAALALLLVAFILFNRRIAKRGTRDKHNPLNDEFSDR